MRTGGQQLLVGERVPRGAPGAPLTCRSSWRWPPSLATASPSSSPRPAGQTPRGQHAASTTSCPKAHVSRTVCAWASRSENTSGGGGGELVGGAPAGEEPGDTCTRMDTQTRTRTCAHGHTCTRMDTQTRTSTRGHTCTRIHTRTDTRPRQPAQRGKRRVRRARAYGRRGCLRPGPRGRGPLRTAPRGPAGSRAAGRPPRCLPRSPSPAPPRTSRSAPCRPRGGRGRPLRGTGRPRSPWSLVGQKPRLQSRLPHDAPRERRRPGDPGRVLTRAARPRTPRRTRSPPGTRLPRRLHPQPHRLLPPPWSGPAG